MALLFGIFQVIEYFQDFDPLRSGVITKKQFRRGLSSLGFSTLGEHNLSEAQFETLYQHYKSSRLPENVLWTQFMWDVESGKFNVFNHISGIKVHNIFSILLESTFYL